MLDAYSVYQFLEVARLKLIKFKTNVHFNVFVNLDVLHRFIRTVFDMVLA